MQSNEFKTIIRERMTEYLNRININTIEEASNKKKGESFLRFYMEEVLGQLLSLDEDTINDSIYDQQNGKKLQNLYNQIHDNLAGTLSNQDILDIINKMREQKLLDANELQEILEAKVKVKHLIEYAKSQDYSYADVFFNDFDVTDPEVQQQIDTMYNGMLSKVEEENKEESESEDETYFDTLEYNGPTEQEYTGQGKQPNEQTFLGGYDIDDVNDYTSPSETLLFAGVGSAWTLGLSGVAVLIIIMLVVYLVYYYMQPCNKTNRLSKHSPAYRQNYIQYYTY